MTGLAIAIIMVLWGLAILNALFTVAFLSSLSSSSKQIRQDDQLPKAAVILCVRGTDPSLANCVRALINQDYPQYSLRIVVDSWEDPAWTIINEVLQQAQSTQVHVSALRTRYETCSLQCSALVQAISELDDSYDVIALVKANTVPYSDWLRELVAPLADEQVGATTGHEWYRPQIGQWGSLVRSLWSSSSVVFMYVHQMLWGGSMALKLSCLSRARLLEILTKSLAYDVPISRIVQEIGMKVKFVPTLMMIDRQECNLADFLRQSTRYMLWTRLYHTAWITSLALTLIPTLTFVLATILLFIALSSNHMVATVLMGGGLVGYILTLCLLFAFKERGLQQVVRVQGEPIKSFSVLMIAKILVAIPLTHLLGTVAAILATFMRKIKWRDITYFIDSLGNARLLEYRPYKFSSQSVSIKASIHDLEG